MIVRGGTRPNKYDGVRSSTIQVLKSPYSHPRCSVSAANQCVMNSGMMVVEQTCKDTKCEKR